MLMLLLQCQWCGTIEDGRLPLPKSHGSFLFNSRIRFESFFLPRKLPRQTGLVGRQVGWQAEINSNFAKEKLSKQFIKIAPQKTRFRGLRKEVKILSLSLSHSSSLKTISSLCSCVKKGGNETKIVVERKNAKRGQRWFFPTVLLTTMMMLSMAFSQETV